MSGRRTQTYHHGDLKNALVVAAARLIEKRRDTAFTVRELAGEAGVSHAAAYRHFSSKIDILAAVAEAGFAALGRAFADAAQAHPNDNVSELRAQGEAYVRFAVAHTGYFRAMFHGDLGDHTAYPTLATVGGQSFQALVSVITRGIAAGDFVGRTPLELAVMAWSTVHGLATLLVDERMPSPAATPAMPTDLAHRVVDLLLTGLLPRGAHVGRDAEI